MTPRAKSLKPDQTPSLIAEPGLIKSMVETAFRQLLEEEVTRHLAAERHARTGERRGYRNGTKPRTLKTTVGKLHLKVPQVREGGFRTCLFERWQRSDKALVAAMQEMVIHGVSTREVAAVLEQMGGFEVSASTVSEAMKELDGQIREFFGRRLGDRPFPFLMIDARYEKVRKNGRVVSQAVLIAAGIRDDGRRELLGLEVGDSESSQCWGDLLLGLKERGLRGVDLVISDAHRGIRAAMDKHLQGAAWQRCRVHFLRELIGSVSYKDHRELVRDLRSIYASEQPRVCLETAGVVASKWERRAPRMSVALREGIEATLTVYTLPRNLRRRLNSTNMIERLMRELKKRTRKVCSFPSEQACYRLIGAVLLETQDKWDSETKRYIVIDDLSY